MRNTSWLLLGAATLTLTLGGLALAEGNAGPFTTAQVEAGRQAYGEQCAVCHQPDLAGATDAPPLAGSAFMGAWGKRPVAALYSKIHASMPLGRGGSLDDTTYASIVAFILHANGATAGTAPLTAAAEVAIGSIVTGKAPADLTAAAPAAAAAQVSGAKEAAPADASGGEKASIATSAGFAAPGQTVRYSDPGRFVIPSKLGLSLKGDIEDYQPVTDAMLLSPPDGDWLMLRRNYAGWSYSPLAQIDASNVAKLQLKWMWSMPENGTMEDTPIVHAGVMFMWGVGNVVQALDAKTGELLWENRLGPLPKTAGPGPSSEETRSMGVYGTNLYVNTPQGMVYALDARTGEEVWKTHITDNKPGVGYSTGGLMIVHGKVIVGMTNCGRKGTPDHCYISAYDAATGKRDWKFVTVALTGQPGGDTWNGMPDDDRKGGEAWIAGTYDPALNTTYWGTAQAKPWRRDERGSGNGATDYANSTLALDPDTGKLKWAFNHSPGETFDLDEVFERVLIDHGAQKTLMTIGKAGILWKLDRVTGKYLGSTQTVFQNVFTSIDPKTGRPTYRKDVIDQKSDQWLASCPGPEGGHNWQATSYHQPSDTIILPLSQSCVLMLGNGSQVYYEMPGSDGNLGRLSAYRTADMKPLWTMQQRAPFLTGVVSTAGNLAFVGDFDRVFRAVDVRDGRTLWKVRLGTTVQGFPVTFTVDGRQYVAVTTALGGGSPQLKPSTMLGEVHRPVTGYAVYVFGLPDTP
ncbi:outer membrane protein assembly factor BamB family protein [Sphingomonas nostoxanthinifaciens]|uniref:outer membrane protein assembly factor BamB family protein n=1 Tax=Sphingomonas nostoxanthinifaciens TaxID=2872652 RepID=UPI001CC1D857|nr:PQQ-binding-like beta-propeller repeat protein [Sphingomonas nostoxanthinifaciens]UAK23271.1 PQQ-binding-like beta-propeller repeat protein [Sphingomonas nostoxanthinifaciens]